MEKKRIRRNIMGLCLTALALTCASVSAQDREPVPMPVINPDSVMKHIIELSSETYEGRMAGTRGHERAVKYVENVLRRYGVREIKEQPFDVECNEVENCKFNIYTPGSKEKRVFTLGNEFCCAGMTGRGYVDAQMVFCGYGVDNGLLNEYKQVDVKGKIVVVLTGLPSWLPESIGAHYRSLRDKARTAERHGAIGMIAVNISHSCHSYEPQSRIYCGELPHLGTFPILQATADCGRELLTGEEMDLDAAIAAIDNDHRVCSFSTLKKAEIDINAFYRPRATTVNVVGLLEGSDKELRREIIVVGASLDGSGIQGETCLFPGADINASGVAAVLETARVLSDKDYRPRRSVAFVLFSGSEQQYLGSRAFINAYPNLNRVEAFVNVQNIGYGDSLMVLGDNRYPTLWKEAYFCDTSIRTFDKSFSDLQRIWPSATMRGNIKGDSVAVIDDCRFPLMKKLGSHTYQANGRHQIMLSKEKSDPKGDARVFDAMGIPSLVITTHDGLHNNHVTTDIWENIDRRILTMATQLTSDLVCQIGEGLYQGRSPQSKAQRFRE